METKGLLEASHDRKLSRNQQWAARGQKSKFDPKLNTGQSKVKSIPYLRQSKTRRRILWRPSFLSPNQIALETQRSAPTSSPPTDPTKPRVTEVAHLAIIKDVVKRDGNTIGRVSLKGRVFSLLFVGKNKVHSQLRFRVIWVTDPVYQLRCDRRSRW